VFGFQTTRILRSREYVYEFQGIFEVSWSLGSMGNLCGPGNLESLVTWTSVRRLGGSLGI